MTVTSITALLGTMVLLSAVPGPSDIAVVARSIEAGFQHSLLMIAGIIVADFLFIILAVYGLAAVAETLGSYFVIIQFICGAYLIWLGYSSIRAHSSNINIIDRSSVARSSSFISGLLITLGDPKAIFFYMGLLPAFIDLENVSATDTAIIMIAATLAIGGVKTSYAYLAGRAVNLFEDRRINRSLNRAAGGLLVGTGIFILSEGSALIFQAR